MSSLGLFSLALLGYPDWLAAQEGASPVIAASADNGGSSESDVARLAQSSPFYRLRREESPDDDGWIGSVGPGTDAPLTLGVTPLRPTGMASGSADALELRSSDLDSHVCSVPRLLSGDSGECDRRMGFAGLAMEGGRRFDDLQTELPPSGFLERHRVLFSTLIPIVSVGGVMANSLFGYDKNHSLKVHHEGWFGADTTNGGADKASHMTDYFVVANLFDDVYRMLGWSENSAIVWGFSLAVATGLANELSDGFTRHGFSPEDFAVDTIGAAAASVVSWTHTRDLFSMRVSHLPGSSYTHDVYSADLKLSGLAQRLGLNIGPLRWLLFSVTYGAKGYRVTPEIELQRQVGFEIGLNLQQILNDIGVRRTTWWGYGLHLIGDNVRFPFTAVGMRYDMNHNKWHGPNNGNYP